MPYGEQQRTAPGEIKKEEVKVLPGYSFIRLKDQTGYGVYSEAEIAQFNEENIMESRKVGTDADGYLYEQAASGDWSLVEEGDHVTDGCPGKIKSKTEGIETQEE